jgi:hypothetical protein
MVWTDIFIKRPVLALVVSLLILLIAAVSKAVEYRGQRHDGLSRRVG